MMSNQIVTCVSRQNKYRPGVLALAARFCSILNSLSFLRQQERGNGAAPMELIGLSIRTIGLPW